MKHDLAMKILPFGLLLNAFQLDGAASEHVRIDRLRKRTYERVHLRLDAGSQDRRNAWESHNNLTDSAVHVSQGLRAFLPPRVTAKISAEDAHWQWLPISALLFGSVWLLWRKASNHVLEGSFLLEFAFVLILYNASAPAIIFCNNDLINRFGFEFPITVASMGVLGTTIVSHTMTHCGTWPLTVEKIGMDSWLRSVLPLALCGALSLIVGNFAYLILPVSLLQVLKSTTLVLTLVFGWLAGVEKPTWGITGAVLLIFIGSAAAPIDFANIFSMHSSVKSLCVGLMLSFCANIAEAGRIIMTQVSVLKLSFQDALYWCSRAMLGTQIVLILVFESRGLAKAHWTRAVVLRLIGSMLAGAVVTISSWWLTKLVGGLSLKVLTNARNYAVIAMAIYFYSEPFTKVECICYTACLSGVFFYEASKAAAREMKA